MDTFYVIFITVKWLAEKYRELLCIPLYLFPFSPIHHYLALLWGICYNSQKNYQAILWTKAQNLHWDSPFVTYSSMDLEHF